MILADTSAWVEFLRDTGSTVCDRMVEEIKLGGVASSEVVRMEILAGARSDRQHHELQRLLARTTSLRTEPIDFELAASIYRTCRRAGRTIRQLNDCLIGAQAIRADVPLLHADRDFDVLARHTPLQIA